MQFHFNIADTMWKFDSDGKRFTAGYNVTFIQLRSAQYKIEKDCDVQKFLPIFIILLLQF